MSNPTENIVDLMLKLAPLEGYNLTSLSDVRLLRSNRPLSKTPVLYDPGIVIVCQGSKRGYFGEQCYLYDAEQYLAISVPVPFTMETDASTEQPLLAIYIHLNFKLAAELMLQLEQQGFEPPDHSPKSMISSRIEPALASSVIRFLQGLSKPLEAEILGPSLLRELYFHFLTGKQSNEIRSALAMQGQFGKISQVLKHIHHDYAKQIDLAQLAAKARMSVPTFHTHFKSITQMPPMQYVKSVRLHQARMLMARQSITAASASHAVGYESPSQFNREFKRLFGLPPAEEVKRMKEHFAVPPIHSGAEYVSSH
uniref:AraC-type transcriptional regulator domain protein n=1 Tax=Marinomonas sp. (strain MWYL1) TaxID=400668 RepID=A6VXV3_MARMS